MERLPLDGIRVLDLTRVWAGPYATRLLADMGAEVIKVEGPNAWDLTRSLSLLGAEEHHAYNKAAYFNHYNRNKYGAAIDFQKPAGRNIALRLIEMSDVVIENHRADVLEHLDLAYDTMRSVREDVILVSMPSHGLSGPEAGYVAYGTHMEQLAGLVSLSGYVDGPPQRSGISYGDPMAGLTAACATIAALLYRRWTGLGQHIEVAQWEGLLPFIGEFFVEYSMTGREPQRMGNGHRFMAPHGTYRCAGEDSWMSLAVGSDVEFAGLCDVIGRPELERDARFADCLSRYRNRAELDEIVSAWAGERSHHDAAGALQAKGVAASPVLEMRELLEDAHLNARGFFEEVTHREAGTWMMDGPAWRFDRTPAHTRLPAPCFAEHNDYVLRELLGMSESKVAELEREGVVAREPAPGQDE